MLFFRLFTARSRIAGVRTPPRREVTRDEVFDLMEDGGHVLAVRDFNRGGFRVLATTPEKAWAKLVGQGWLRYDPVSGVIYHNRGPSIFRFQASGSVGGD